MAKNKGLSKKQLRIERKAKKSAVLSKLTNGKTGKKRQDHASSANANEPSRNQDCHMDTTDQVAASLSQDVTGSGTITNVNMVSTVDLPQVQESHRIQKANLKIKYVGTEASLETAPHERVPILLSDVQHLLLTATLDSHHPYSSPRWIGIEKRSSLVQTIVLIVDGLSVSHFDANTNKFPHLNKFKIKLEVVTPSVYGGSIVDELATVPLTESEKELLVIEYGSIEAAVQARKDLLVMLRMVFPVKDNSVNNLATGNQLTDNFPRTQLILSAWQLVEENYPLPLKGKLMNNYAGYVMTKDVYEPVSAHSPMFGLDCEMCQTVAGSELTRISLVDEKHKVVYEKLVLPHNKIIDYLTCYSGITAEMMTNVKTRVTDVQKDIREILPPNAILVGQSLNFDLHALKMMHPYIIDTSVIFNTTGERNRKSKLKILAKRFLNEDIQEGSNGHCSIEDSIASLKLVQLKLVNSISYGDEILASRNKLTSENQRKIARKEYSTNIFNKVVQNEKTSIVVGHESVTQKYSSYVKKICQPPKSDGSVNKIRKIKCVNCEDNASVIDKTKSLLSGKHNLIMSHINMEPEMAGNIDNALECVNNCTNELLNQLPMNSLFVLIFSGTRTCNGASFVCVKK